jgi:ribosome-associated protein
MKVTVHKKENHIPVVIHTEFIKLESALKLSNAVSTGGQAKWIIQDELVKVNGDVCTSRGKKLFEGDSFEYERVIYDIVK